MDIMGPQGSFQGTGIYYEMKHHDSPRPDIGEPQNLPEAIEALELLESWAATENAYWQRQGWYCYAGAWHAQKVGYQDAIKILRQISNAN